MLNFKEEIAKEISKLTKIDYEETINMIEIPREKGQGDYSFPCFKLAKILKKAPQVIATEISSSIEFNNDLIEKQEIVGGYINFFVNKELLTKTVVEEIKNKKSEYGKSSIGKNKNIIVEYSSPNIAKPFHIGHLRTTLIGRALYNTYKYLGYNTIRN